MPAIGLYTETFCSFMRPSLLRTASRLSARRSPILPEASVGLSPSLPVIGQDEDDGEDLEEALEEYPSESNPELNIDLDLDSDSDLVPSYSSFWCSLSWYFSHLPPTNGCTTSKTDTSLLVQAPVDKDEDEDKDITLSEDGKREFVITRRSRRSLFPP